MLAVQPLARTLAPAAAKLAQATPLVRPRGRAQHSAGHACVSAEQRFTGYLYWGAWLSHILDSLTSTQDANGPLLQSLFMASCPALNLLEVTLEPGSPSLGPLIDLLNPPDYSKIHSSYCVAAGGL